MSGYVDGLVRPDQQPSDGHMRTTRAAAPGQHTAMSGCGLSAGPGRPLSAVYDSGSSRQARCRSQHYPHYGGADTTAHAGWQQPQLTLAKPPVPDRPRHLRLTGRPDPHRVYPADTTHYASLDGLETALAAATSGWTHQTVGRPTPPQAPHQAPHQAPPLQASPAALLFARAAQLRLSSPHKKRRHRDTEEQAVSGFSATLRREPPPLPAALQRRLGTQQESGLGKVRVLLRVRQSQPSSHFSVDLRKKQVTLLDPSAVAGAVAPAGRRLGVAAPKMFAFDGVFHSDDPQSDICTSALVDVIHAVINGNDGCVLCLGQTKTGKTTTMLGGSGSTAQLGVIPTAISWLYRGICEQKQRSGARFSVRVSAVQISGPAENLRDLLKDHAKDCDQSPGVYLREDPVLGSQLQNQSEVRAETAEKAALFLDAAAAARVACEEAGRSSHLLYTLHVFQYSVKSDKTSGVTGGRSRLHLFDLGSFEKTKTSGLTLSAVGNVIVSIFNAHKHVPCRDSKLVHLFREAMGSLTCQTTIVAHVSTDAALYAETLTTVQLASRIHRMRRRRVKPHGSSGSGGSAEENRSARLRSSGDESSGRSSSDVDPSSSEQSADTVIYLGPGADECTDGEHPPVYIPSLNSDHRGAMSKVLEGGKCRSPARTSGGVCPPAHRMPTVGAVVFSPQHRAGDKLTGAVPKSPQIKRKLHEQRSAGAADRHPTQERWVDGPRFSRSRIAEAHKIKARQETWIDGPAGEACPATVAAPSGAAAAPSGATAAPPAARPTRAAEAAAAARSVPPPPPLPAGYGFMDDHKKSMITRWVEHQIEAVTTKKRPKPEETPRPTHYRELTQFKTEEDEPPQRVLTQFKTQESSGENSPTLQRHPAPAAAHRASPETSVSQQKQKVRPTIDSETTPPSADQPVSADAPPTQAAATASQDATTTLDEICAQCEQLVDVLSQEGDTGRPPDGTRIPPVDDSERAPADGSTAAPADNGTAAPANGNRTVPSGGKDVADAAQNTDEADSASDGCSEPEKQPSSSSSSDVARGEIIEVEERDEPVPTVDSCLQVTEEDIAHCMGLASKSLLLPPLDFDDSGHPLRALSEENLTFASSFSDMYTLRGGSDGEPLYEVAGSQLSELQIPDYGRLCDDLSLTNQRLDGITRLHELYRELAAEPTPAPPTPLISHLLMPTDKSDTASVCSEPARPVACQRCKTLKRADSLRHGNYVKSIKDWLALLPDLESEGEEYICDSCRRKQNEELDQIGDDFEIQSDITPYLPTFSSLASLRHPDGASNPNLSKHSSLLLSERPPAPPPTHTLPDRLPDRLPGSGALDERLPGNGASGSDEDSASCGLRQPPSAACAAEPAAGRADAPSQSAGAEPAAGDSTATTSRAQLDPLAHHASPASPAKPKPSKFGRLFGRGRSASRSPSKATKARYVSAEVCGAICSPRYPERGLGKDKKAAKEKATEQRKKSKERERKSRGEPASAGAPAPQDRLSAVASSQPADQTPNASWRPPVGREKYSFTCDTTLPAFLPAVSCSPGGYDSGNDSGIGLRKSQKKSRKAAEPCVSCEGALPPSECSSLESSQESEEEPRLNRRNGQVQAGSPAHQATARSDCDPARRGSRQGRALHHRPDTSLRAEITVKSAAKKTWAPGIPVFSRLWHRKAKPAPLAGPAPGAPVP